MRTLLFILVSFTALAQDDPYLHYSKYHRIGINGVVKTITEYKYIKLDYDKNAPYNVSGELRYLKKKWFDKEGYLTKDSTYSIVSHKGYTFNSYQEYSYVLEDSAIKTITYRIRSDSNDTTKINTNVIVCEKQNNLSYSYHFVIGKHPFNPRYLTFDIQVLDGKIVFTDNIYYSPKKAKSSQRFEHYYYNNHGSLIKKTIKSYKKTHMTINYKTMSTDSLHNPTLLLEFRNKKKQPYSMIRYVYEYYE